MSKLHLWRIIRHMYDIYCIRVLLRLIKNPNIRFMKASWDFWSEGPRNAQPRADINEHEACLMLKDRFVLYKRLDDVDAINVVKLAEKFEYVKLEKPTAAGHGWNIVEITEKGYILISGPLYAGLIQELTAKWGGFLKFASGFLLSGIVISVFAGVDSLSRHLYHLWFTIF